MKYFIAFAFAIIIGFGVAGCEDKKEKETTDTVTTEAQDAAVLSEDATPAGASSDVVVAGG